MEGDGMSEDKEFPLWHQSGVNRDGEPFIQLILGEKVIAQQSVQQAREHALAILEAAEAAEQDAFIVHWCKTILGQTEQVAGQILVDFRNFRREQTGKRSGQEVIPPQKGKTA
jgi:inorganic pyrophosphatase